MALGDYTPTAWVNGATPAINATNLGHLETKINELDDWDAGIKAGTSTVDGVKFPATQVPSADPNTLDDYEKNTFIPGISFGGASVGITYTTQTGQYTKIGNAVFYDMIIVLSSKGSSTGNALITGLPFASSSGTAAPPSFRFTLVSFADFPQGLVVASTNTIALTEITNAGTVTTLVDTNFANNSAIYCAGHYFV